MAKTPDTDNNAYREYGLLDPGLLRLRARIGKDISPADVADIIEEHPDLVDEEIREYVLRGLRGELKKKRGRKRTSVQELKELYAVHLYDYLYPRIKARYEREQARGKIFEAVDYAASELANVITAKHIGMKTWEATRNLISSYKKRQNYE